jgi:phosphoglycerol transferase
MTTTTAATSNSIHARTLAALTVGVCAYLSYRNWGLNPAVFADEWYYSKMSRLMELKDAIVPSYLYLWLFKASNACGTGFLDCVRIGNLLLLAAATPFVYQVARQFTGKNPALAVALLSILAPLNLYTVYFMPESIYYLGFWVLSWIVLTRRHWGWRLYAMSAGLVLGMMSLIKVHALFLIPALCLFLLYARWNGGGRWLASGLQAGAVAALAVLAVKFGIGYLFAGNAALHWLGPFYQSSVDVSAARPVLALLMPVLVSAHGHLMTLSLLLGVPLAMLAYGLVAHVFRDRNNKLNVLLAYTTLMLAAAGGVTVLFTATLAGPDNHEGIRLHLRYYSFLFPMLWMLAAAAIDKSAARSHPVLRWSIGLVLLVVLGFAYVQLPGYARSPVDGPEIFAIHFDKFSGKALVGLEALALLLWAGGKRAAAPWFLYVTVPALLAAGVAGNTAWLREQIVPNTADKAGAAAHRHVPLSEQAGITVISSDLGQSMRALFRIDNKDAVTMQLSEDTPVAQFQLPPSTKWVLVLGKHALPEGVRPVVAAPDYVLARLTPSSNRRIGSARFSEAFGQGLIARTEGLSTAEDWGRWSDAKQVVLHFNQPLPRHLNVTLRAKAFDMNGREQFSMQAGERSKPFRLGQAMEELNLHFETDGNARSLTIQVPHPVSPEETGRPGDRRKLGIGISEIEIGESIDTELTSN